MALGQMQLAMEETEDRKERDGRAHPIPDFQHGNPWFI